MLKEKGDIRMHAATSFGDEFEGTEFQGSYAITNEVGVMTNVFFVDKVAGEEWGNGRILELGGGYFRPFGHSGTFEVFGGMGLGRVENRYNEGEITEVKFRRYFAQPSIGYKRQLFEAAFAVRVVALDYQKINYQFFAPTVDNSDFLANELPHLRYIENNPFSIIIEPAFTIRFGFKYVKFQTQVVFSRNFSNPELQQERSNINFGVFVPLSIRDFSSKTPKN